MRHISFENISHFYSDMPSVKDVSFNIGKGEVVCLLGPSGCGKSTLLRLAAGLEKPQNGYIKQDDKVISSSKNALDPSERGVGLVFQNYALFPHLTVLDNVCYGLSGKKRDNLAAAQQMMTDFDIAQFANHYPYELSGGQQQRVALARAICPEPPLVLLDEPFSGLDTRLRERIRDKLLHVLREKNIAAIMVTHDAEEAMFMSDKIVVLSHGKVAQIGTPLEVYRSPQSSFVATFFGEANQFSAIVKNGRIETVLGAIDAPSFDDGTEVEVVIRNENLRVYDQKQKDASPVAFKIMETHLLGSNTLVHLSDTDDDTGHHFHAKIPGLNFFEIGREVFLAASPNDIFVFNAAK
ncbi:MAG: ABC transporter ATP-binding protein [Candidatus Puniceispirillaceae bacterium]